MKRSDDARPGGKWWIEQEGIGWVLMVRYPDDQLVVGYYETREDASAEMRLHVEEAAKVRETIHRRVLEQEDLDT